MTKSRRARRPVDQVRADGAAKDRPRSDRAAAVDPGEAESPAGSPWPRPWDRLRPWDCLSGVVLLVASCFVAFQPIASDDLWWWLSQGRQVIGAGTMTPSGDLLSEDDRGEASWLAGSIPAFAYVIGGASGLMLIRLSVVAAIGLAVARLGLRVGRGNGPIAAWWTFLISTLALVSISPELDPVTSLWDLIAVGVLGAGLAWVTGERNSLAAGSRPVTVGAAVLFVFWSNFGRFPTLGLGIVVAFALATLLALPRHRSRTALLSAASILLAAVVGGSLNPIGWRVWIDSFVMLCPWAVASPVVAEAFGWGPLTRVSWDFATILFVGLSVAWGCRRVFAPAPVFDGRSLAMLVVQFFVWTSGSLVPLGVVWVAIEWIGYFSRDREDRPGEAEETRAGRLADRSDFPKGRFAVMVATVGLAIVSTSSGPFGVGGRFWEAGARGGLFATFGWGIDSRLDPRHLELALAESNFRSEAGSRTVFTDDVRSAGIVAWILGPPGSPDDRAVDGGAIESGAWRAQDHPERALLGGRLADHHRLLLDLREGRQMRYWRDDGQPGGWWLALEQRDTALIACSRRDVMLIRRLEPSIWKPLSLESPVLPYARAGDPRFTRRILEVLGRREAVDQRPWEYRPPVARDSPYDRRRWGWGPRDLRSPLSQAQVFLAMELRTATLRVLAVARDQWPHEPRFLRVWVRCQTELADQEQLVAGRSSRFRSLAAGLSDEDVVKGSESGEGTSLGPVDKSEGRDERGPDPLHEFVKAYRSDGAQAALRLTAEVETPGGQLEYAKLCWMMETGAYDEALRVVWRMRSEAALEPEIAVLVRHRESELWWLQEKSARR